LKVGIKRKRGEEIDSMVTLSVGTRDLICALFAYEFAEGSVDHVSIDEIRAGQTGDWIEAIEASALFGSADMMRIRTVFENDPEQLVEMLLESVDELRLRRTSGDGVVRPAPFGARGLGIGQATG
jgi:hypothetical protein